MLNWSTNHPRVRATGATLTLTVLALALLGSGCGSTRPHQPQATPAEATPSPSVTAAAVQPSATQPCGVSQHPPQHYQHVVWILMENRDYPQIVGSSEAPYLNHLAQLCGLATDYRAITHPSLPNYIALTSGSTQGISDDGPPSSHQLAVASIFSLLGGGWASLDEAMPSPCDLSSTGEYATKHNPAVYYTNLASQCGRQDRPLTSPPDLSASFTMITPNLCDDMHDCATRSGDSWLSTEVPQLLDSPQYRSGQTAIFITWDEGIDTDQVVPTLVLAPTVVPGVRPATAYNHYSLLRTTEELLGLSPLLGGAASAASMRAGFNI